MPQNFPTPVFPWADAGAGSIYTGGGSAATYDLGGPGGRGRHGGWGGGMSLEGQMGGLLDYIAKRQDWLEKSRYNRQKGDVREDRMAQQHVGDWQRRAPAPAAPQTMPQRDLMQNKNMLDSMLTTNPRGTNPEFFNLPAAAALTYGKSPFPDGWATYAALAGAGKLPGEVYNAAMKQVPSGDAGLFNPRLGGGGR